MILLPIISTWLSIEGHRRLVQVAPDAVQKLWNKCELRALVLISLVSQIILTVLGDRKNVKPNMWIRSLVWAAYMIADWVATFALGVITSTLGTYNDKSSGEHKDMNPQLIAFWAPFFLVHLGGPDTIIAYSLEDNELWLRHLAGLVAQTGVTTYIIVLSWKNTCWLSYLSIPMLIVGFMRYGERIWSLYSVSIEHLRDSLIPWTNAIYSEEDHATDSSKEHLFGFMSVFVSLFLDLISRPIIMMEKKCGPSLDLTPGVFVSLHSMLGMMYDIFYTKAFAIYNFRGSILRLITSLATMVVLLLYIIFSENNDGYLAFDPVITSLLLVAAVILEIHALGLLLLSPWMVWGLDHFSEFRKILRTCFRTKASSYHKLKLSLGHTNFLPLIHNENKKLSGNSLSAKTLQDVLNIGHCKISSDLQDTIITYYKKKAEKIMHSSFSSLSRPGYSDHVSNHLKVTMASNLEFHRAIITWHIVTDLCYYNDEDLNSKSRNASKNLSDYMFYLLVHCRHMLPVGYGLLTLQDTYDEAKKHFPKKRYKRSLQGFASIEHNYSNI